jgi:hypothetical protein
MDLTSARSVFAELQDMYREEHGSAFGSIQEPGA